MRTAFLIMAHSEAVVTRRLIRRLEVPWATTFVHVDRKADQTPFTQGMENVSNLIFLPDGARRRVYWGTFSLAKTMLDLARFALAEDAQLHRIFMLSGVDYPIAPLDTIRQAAAGEAEYIRIDRLLTQGGPGVQDRFLGRRRLTSSLWLNERTGPPAIRRLGRMVENLLPRPEVGSAPIYHGSTSWALTAATLRQIIGLYDSQPELLDRLRHVHVPEEMIVHSAIKALPAADRVTQDATAAGGAGDGLDPYVHGLHFIDWSKGGSGPPVLVMEDLARLTASGTLFARKMSAERSMALLDTLDARDG